MDYVVFKSGGKQYRAKTGDTLEVDKILGDKDNVLEFEEVLLLVNGGKVSLGKPYVKGAKVKATIVEQKKGPKLRVSKFKAKARYRRTVGFRPMITTLRVEGFGIGEAKAEVKKTAPKASKKVKSTAKK